MPKSFINHRHYVEVGSVKHYKNRYNYPVIQLSQLRMIINNFCSDVTKNHF